MSLSQVYTAVIGHIITAARWNNEFGNIYANGTDLSFPLTKAVSLAGFTLTIDSAGVTTLTSTASQGFILTPGSKNGTPSANGSFFNLVAATYTDTNTAGAGICALWAGTSFRIPTLAATNSPVTTTDACTVYIEGPPTQGTNETFTESSALFVNGKIKCNGDFRLRGEDSRTNSIVEPMTIQMTTSGTPASGIGTGMSFQAESADEAPSVLGTLDFEFTDVTAASEDSRMRIKTRVAGALAAETFSWQAFGAFSAQFQHTNTAARTYTLPDFSCVLGGATITGPSSIGAGSTEAHEGTVTISANQALQGIHYYTNFTLDAGKVLTLADASGRLVIVATGTITINGTIDGIGAGSPGGLAGSLTAATQAITNGIDGFTNPGGGGGAGDNGGAGTSVDAGAGGRAFFGCVAGGVGGIADGGSGAQGANLTAELTPTAHYSAIWGGAGGGGGSLGSSGNGGAGGNGGASIVLVAPAVVLGVASVLNTSAATGANGAANNGGGGGGGSAGNVYVFCNSFTDNGCTYTMTAGSGGTGNATGGDGAAGRAGVKQINIYA